MTYFHNCFDIQFIILFPTASLNFYLTTTVVRQLFLCHANADVVCELLRLHGYNI